MRIMAKYYIRITDEQPLPSEKGITFELETTAEDNSDQLYVLNQNDYNALVEDFEGLEQEFTTIQTNLSSSPTLVSAVETAISGISGMENAKYIKDDDSGEKYSYSDLETALDSKALKSTVSSLQSSVSQWEVQTLNLSSQVYDKADKTTVEQLQNSLQGYSDISHVHKTWTYRAIGDYGNLWINNHLGIAFFNYYRKDRSLKKGKDYTIVDIGSYALPRGSTKLSCYNPHLGASIGTDGVVTLITDVDGTFNINMSGMFII